MTSNQPPEHFTDAPLCTVNWDPDDDRLNTFEYPTEIVRWGDGQ